MTRSMLLCVTMLTAVFVPTGQAQEPAPAPPQQLKALPLKIISARVVAAKLAARFGDARITFDASTNTVFIHANAETIRLATEAVERLEARHPKSKEITVVFLKHAVVEKTADRVPALMTVLSLFDDSWEWCHVRAIPRANAFVISAGAEKMQQLRRLLQELDGQPAGDS